MDMNVKSIPAIRKSSRMKPSKLKGLLDDVRRFQLTPDAYMRVAQVLWADLDTPKSLACMLLLKHGEFAQLVALGAHPSGYVDHHGVAEFLGAPGASRFRDDYQSVTLLAKWPLFHHPDLDPVGACERADLAAEESCRQSNRRLRKLISCPEGQTRYMHLLSMMQRDIGMVLGDFDPTEWEQACRFGPGKATDQIGSIDYEKLIARPSATPNFLLPGTALIAECPAWLDALDPGAGFDPFDPLEGELVHRFDVVEVPGDKNSMVPKNAKTHRGIRPQPGLNVFAQLGLGEMKKKRLRLAGLDLSDQRPNQDLARRGSKRGSNLVTLDLRGASGHICRVLVDFLYQDAYRWKFAMDMCRTTVMLPHGAADTVENWVPLQSYSAMGNGFTFELETLIFWAAVRACRRLAGDSGPYRVYGDDIICERETSLLLVPFLEFIGFPLNQNKSFVEGPFRESCGADFWNGINVRPIHFSVTLEELQEGNQNGTSILRWLQICNSIRRLARARNHGFGCDRRLLASWRTAILYIPRSARNSLKSCWLDDQDTTLITDFEDASTNPLIKRCGNLQSLISPRLYARQPGLVPRSFHGVRATLLYRQRGDRVTCRFDRRWSGLQRVLQLTADPSTPKQGAIMSLLGIKPGVDLHGELLPARHGLTIGGGWEVFQPLADVTAWLHCPEGSSY